VVPNDEKYEGRMPEKLQKTSDLAAGTRLNLMKIAPVVRALDQSAGEFGYEIIHTGQHYDWDVGNISIEKHGEPFGVDNLFKEAKSEDTDSHVSRGMEHTTYTGMTGRLPVIQRCSGAPMVQKWRSGAPPHNIVSGTTESEGWLLFRQSDLLMNTSRIQE
jgi:hypothetical protein